MSADKVEQEALKLDVHAPALVWLEDSWKVSNICLPRRMHNSGPRKRSDAMPNRMRRFAQPLML